jgi:hypothetical protein
MKELKQPIPARLCLDAGRIARSTSRPPFEGPCLIPELPHATLKSECCHVSISRVFSRNTCLLPDRTMICASGLRRFAVAHRLLHLWSQSRICDKSGYGLSSHIFGRTTQNLRSRQVLASVSGPGAATFLAILVLEIDTTTCLGTFGLFRVKPALLQVVKERSSR